MGEIKYKKYTKNELLKILKDYGILFVKTSLGDRYIINKNDLADFIILEAQRTEHTAEIFFFMPGIAKAVITTYGWFLNKANPVLREEIINRLVLLQTTDKKPKNVKVFDTDKFYKMLDDNEINNDINNYNTLYKKYEKSWNIYN